MILKILFLEKGSIKLPEQLKIGLTFCRSGNFLTAIHWEISIKSVTRIPVLSNNLSML